MTLEEQILETARDWTRYYDLAQRTNYPKDHDMADREATQLRNLCRKLKRQERRAQAAEEDRIDNELANASLKEAEEKGTIPYDEVRKELGLDKEDGS